jgi:hypothetical protein
MNYKNKYNKYKNKINKIKGGDIEYTIKVNQMDGNTKTFVMQVNTIQDIINALQQQYNFENNYKLYQLGHEEELKTKANFLQGVNNNNEIELFALIIEFDKYHLHIAYEDNSEDVSSYIELDDRSNNPTLLEIKTKIADKLGRDIDSFYLYIQNHWRGRDFITQMPLYSLFTETSSTSHLKSTTRKYEVVVINKETVLDDLGHINNFKLTNLSERTNYIHNLNKNGLPINPVPTILETLYNTEGIRITNIRSILWRPSYFHRKILKYLTNGVKIIHLKIPDMPNMQYRNQYETEYMKRIFNSTEVSQDIHQMHKAYDLIYLMKQYQQEMISFNIQDINENDNDNNNNNNNNNITTTTNNNNNDTVDMIVNPLPCTYKSNSNNSNSNNSNSITSNSINIIDGSHIDSSSLSERVTDNEIDNNIIDADKKIDNNIIENKIDNNIEIICGYKEIDGNIDRKVSHNGENNDENILELVNNKNDNKDNNIDNYIDNNGDTSNDKSINEISLNNNNNNNTNYVGLIHNYVVINCVSTGGKGHKVHRNPTTVSNVVKYIQKGNYLSINLSLYQSI